MSASVSMPPKVSQIGLRVASPAVRMQHRRRPSSRWKNTFATDVWFDAAPETAVGGAVVRRVPMSVSGDGGAGGGDGGDGDGR